MAYPGQYFHIKIPQGSENRVIVPDTLKITFNLDITSTDKARNVCKQCGQSIGEKKGTHAWFNTL